MKATIIVQDKPDGNVDFHLEFSEPVTDDCTSNAVRAALTMMDALGKEADIVSSKVEVANA